jgi:hypothetical protein
MATRADSEQDAHDNASWHALGGMQRSLGLQHAERARLFSQLLAADGQARGRFVSFGYNATRGELTAYRAEELNATFLDLVHAEGFVANGTPGTHGAAFRMAGDGAAFAAHDNPTALLDVRGADLTVHVMLAGGVAAGNLTDNRTVRLTAANGQHGHLVLVGNGTVHAITGGFQFDLADGGVMFVAHPSGTAAADALHDVLAAAAQGRLGAVASVVDAGGMPLEDTDSWGVQVRAERTGNHSLALRVGSDEPAGKAVVVRTDNDTVPAGRPEDVTVSLDGVALARAASALEVLNGTGEGKAFVTVTAGAVQVVVSVPHFSDHELVLASAAPAGSPGTEASAPPATDNGTASQARPTPALGVSALLVAVAGLAALHRRRA